MPASPARSPAGGSDDHDWKRGSGVSVSTAGRPAESSPVQSAPLLQTHGLTKHFKVGGNLSRKTLHAVDDVDLTINAKEIVALVGESGSGKSTIARLLARVYKP